MGIYWGYIRIMEKMETTVVGHILGYPNSTLVSFLFSGLLIKDEHQETGYIK